MVRFYKKVDANYSDSKMTRILVPKVHINGKINIRMRKNIKTMLNGPYMVINQLRKVCMKGCPSKKLFNIHVWTKKYQSNKK